MGSFTTVARINLNRLRDEVAALQQERQNVARMNWTPAAKQAAERELETKLREVWHELRSATEGLVTAARRRASEVSPAARRREAAFQHPERVTALRALAREASPPDLLAFAKRAAAEGDDAAAFALISAVSARVLDGDDGKAAQEVMQILDVADDRFRHAMVDALGTAQAMSAMAHEYAFAVGDEGALNAARTLALDSHVLKLDDGTARHFDDEEINKLVGEALPA